MGLRPYSLLGLVFVILALRPGQVAAVITAVVPLSQIVEKEQLIFMAKVTEVLPDRPALVLTVDENLKGKAPFERMPVNLSGDTEAKKGKHAEALLERIEKGSTVLMTTSLKGGKYIAFGFINGTWFQMEGRIDKQADAQVVRWNLLHAEPYLRRTFAGTTQELKQIIVEAIANKKAPPEPDEKQKPGFGPPVKKNSGLFSPAYLPLAVIQLPFLGLIAALAAIFPTVFGGLALFMKRWVAALSTCGLISLFVTVPLLFPGWSAQQPIYSPAGTWLMCGVIFTAGALWSLRRYRRALESGQAEIMQPRRVDRRVLTVLFVGGAVCLVVGWVSQASIWQNEWWRWALAATVACAAGSWYLVTRAFNGRSESTLAPIAPESVMLWVLVSACAIYGSWEAGRYSQNAHGLMQASSGAGAPALNRDVVWKFEPKCGGYVVNTCSTPERIYVAVMVLEGLSGRHGRIYALDPADGTELWHFDNDIEKDSDLGMKPAFSAPVYHDGRLYFGEGLHTDNGSRLFCLDAASGNKLWEYRTDSHTESTPYVAEGKVVIGAGYHGIHCLDAIKGPGPENQPLWRYPPSAKADDRALHVDCNPVIANGRVYAGSGYKPELVSNEGKLNSVFCLDLGTGREIWTERVDDSAYGSPLLHQGHVFFGIGNSTYSDSLPSKRPGIICRDAENGQEIWNTTLPETVIGRPAADKFQLFVGCLNGKGYALDLRTGKVNWELNMDGAVQAGPVVDVDPNGIAMVVYYAGKTGNLAAADPYSGRVYWGVPLTIWTRKPIGYLSATPTMLRTETESTIGHRLFVGFGEGAGGSTPRLYCVEDSVAKK